MATLEDRYGSIRYKVHLAEGSLSNVFPALFKHKEFEVLKRRENCDAIVRYICYLYDKNTTLVHEYQSDLKSRKEEAAGDAKLKRVNGKWTEDVQKILDIKDDEVTAAIMQYLKLQRHNVWTEICIIEQELFEYQSLRFTPVSSKKGKKALDEKLILESAAKKEALMKACSIRITKLGELYGQFFGDNVDVQAEFEESITPETAQRILPLDDKPYQEIKGSMHVLQD